MEDMRFMDKIKFDISDPVEADHETLHKVFDRETYVRESGIRSLKKEELLEALINEAHVRYNVQCELSDERSAFRRLKDTLNEARMEKNKWHTVASGLRQVVNNLMGY